MDQISHHKFKPTKRVLAYFCDKQKEKANEAGTRITSINLGSNFTATTCSDGGGEEIYPKTHDKSSPALTDHPSYVSYQGRAEKDTTYKITKIRAYADVSLE